MRPWSQRWCLNNKAMITEVALDNKAMITEVVFK